MTETAKHANPYAQAVHMVYIHLTLETFDGW